MFVIKPTYSLEKLNTNKNATIDASEKVCCAYIVKGVALDSNFV